MYTSLDELGVTRSDEACAPCVAPQTAFFRRKVHHVNDGRSRDQDPLLETRQVVKNYAGVHVEQGAAEVPALRGVSVRIWRGERVAIVGRSGSGKSTLLNLFGTLDQPSSGSVWLDGVDISTLNDRARTRIRRRSLGFVFQFFNLIATQSALENVMLPAILAGLSAREARRLALERLDQVGLAHRAGHHPFQLSGGEMQRTAIARALVLDPPLLLADEPTGNLDTATGEAILALLAQVATSARTVVVVTHDASVAQRQDRIITMRDGLVESDRASDRALNSRNDAAPAAARLESLGAPGLYS